MALFLLQNLGETATTINVSACRGRCMVTRTESCEAYITVKHFEYNYIIYFHRGMDEVVCHEIPSC